ncbi:MULTISPECIES: hypothetical protein [unclassified Mesorhizobium]|nr:MULTISPECIES: hypothetical protein [unclassified Mesorhizobium]
MAKARRAIGAPDQDDFPLNRHPDPALCWSMISSENRFPLSGIMLFVEA